MRGHEALDREDMSHEDETVACGNHDYRRTLRPDNHTDYMDSSNHLYTIRVPGINEDDRNKTIEKMAERGVATNVHYKPLPMMTAYRDMSGGIEQYGNSYDYYKNLITLPLHTKLTDEDVEYVCECLTDAVKECK